MIYLLTLPFVLVAWAALTILRGLRRARAPRPIRLIAGHIEQHQKRPRLQLVKGGRSR